MTHQEGVMPYSSDNIRLRLTYVLGGLAVALVLIASLSLILKRGSWPAVLLLDMNLRELQMFPYPFTIQNLMWVIFGWGVGNALYRRRQAKLEATPLARSLLPTDERVVLLKRDLGEIRQKAREGEDTGFLGYLINQCILNFQATSSYEQTHQVMNTLIDQELHRVDLRFTTLRYLAWLLPTIGFIGTVVGIAAALQHVGSIQGDDLGAAMRPVTARLAVAFNTTIMALAMSVIVVQLTQFVQKQEEEVVNANASYCLRNLVNRLHIPKGEE